MILAMLNKEIPIEWYHDPTLQDNNGNTVALILINRKIIPPKEWMHNYTIKN